MNWKILKQVCLQILNVINVSTSKGLGQHVRMKHRISQVDGITDDEAVDASIPVNVNEVTKTFKIVVEDSLREEIEDELESVWDGNKVTSFSVKKKIG